MATATHSRRDLYASSDPRPKDSTKRRNGSPPKKSPTQKSHTKRHKKEMSKEEISLLTYKSISLLLDAARVLDEAEKKTPKTSPRAKSSRLCYEADKKASKPSPPTKPTRVFDEAEKKASKPSPPVKPTVKPDAKKPTPTPSEVFLATPAISSIFPSQPIVSPQTAALPFHISPSFPSGIPPQAVAEPFHLTPADSTIFPPPQPFAPSHPAAKPFHHDHQYTAVCALAASDLTPSDQPSSQSDPETDNPERARLPGPKPEPLLPIKFPVKTATPLSTPLEPLSISVPEATVPFLSPAIPMLRPLTLAESLMHRPITAIPIPDELRDIALPIAHRSVTTLPKKSPKTPRKPRGPNKKKGKTHAQVKEEIERQRNFGYLDESRTRIPFALRRYWARLEKSKKDEDVFYHDYYWK